MANLRCAELRRIFVDRYGHVLPDDDAGRDDAAVMLHHLAGQPGGDPRRTMSAWASLWLPWASPEEASRMIDDVLATPRRWRADSLAKHLGLAAETRTRLKIRTIGAVDLDKAERENARKTQQAEDKRAKRRAKGVLPRDEYLAQFKDRAKPWEAEGISRRTWYRRQAKQVAQGLTNSNLPVSIEDGPSVTNRAAVAGRYAPACGLSVAVGAARSKHGKARDLNYLGEGREEEGRIGAITISESGGGECP